MSSSPPGTMGAPTPGGPYPGLGVTNPNTDDPAFQPPTHPLEDVAALRNRVQIIHREIPNVSIQSGWSVSNVRSALEDLTVGLFDLPSQLLDTIAGDSRVQSAMRSRSGGLLGRPIRFYPAHHPDKDLAKKVCREWERHWPEMHAEPALLDMLETGGSLGFAYQQIVWDTDSEVWKPYLQAFNPRYSYYHWAYRVHVAVTLDGQVPVVGGDGHWVLHAPYGSYRGWMRGAMRALSQWWLARNYALRDWARYCERHGFPIIKFETPYGADASSIAAGQAQLTGIGQESVIQLPGSVDVNKYGKYDLSYLEASDRNWAAFKALIDQCNDEITLALLGQNLTSQVKEGSFAAARVHADVRQAILEADARAVSRTLYCQVARPFAALNYGDAELAPRIKWDVSPPEDLKEKAQTAQAAAGTFFQLRNAGFQPKDPNKFFASLGVRGMDLVECPPVQIEAQLARATGKVADSSAQGLTKAGPAEGEGESGSKEKNGSSDGSSS